MTHHASHKGFVILFAIVISAAILLVGAGMFSVAFKETVLASTASEAHISLFAADTGIECVLYHEFVCLDNEPGNCSLPDVTCEGDVFPVEIINGSASEPSLASYRFSFDSARLPSCGEVVVMRNQTEPGNNDPLAPLGTKIFSRGYNVCVRNQSIPAPDTTSQFLTERRLEIWYPNPVVVTPPPTP